jgi:hypothetical protein
MLRAAIGSNAAIMWPAITSSVQSYLILGGLQVKPAPDSRI